MGLEARRDSERNCNRGGGRFGGEPSLRNLADPVVQAVMSVDHVTAERVIRAAMMWETRERPGQRLELKAKAPGSRCEKQLSGISGVSLRCFPRKRRPEMGEGRVSRPSFFCQFFRLEPI